VLAVLNAPTRLGGRVPNPIETGPRWHVVHHHVRAEIYLRDNGIKSPSSMI